MSKKEEKPRRILTAFNVHIISTSALAVRQQVQQWHFFQADRTALILGEFQLPLDPTTLALVRLYRLRLSIARPTRCFSSDRNR